jgi:GNAT superfamily N-acetyltransferase
VRSNHEVRSAGSDDAESVGRLLHDFNREVDEPTPGPERLAIRIEELLEEGHTEVLLAGSGPDALAVLRFRPAIWSQALECYLAELYVAPEARGRGLGRALMDAAIELARNRGADHMDLGTGEQDVAARALTRASASATAKAGRTVRSTTSTSASCDSALAVVVVHRAVGAPQDHVVVGVARPDADLVAVGIHGH